MKNFKIYNWFLIICLMAYGYSLRAGNHKFDLQVERPDSTQLQYILYFDILQPLISGKAGLAFSIKNPGLEYQVHANYIFSRSRMVESPFENAGQRKWSSYATKAQTGFELGAQVRLSLGSDWKRQEYAKFIVDHSMISGYFIGSWGELAIRKMTLAYGSSQNMVTREAKMGGLFGWSGSNRKIGFDIFGAVGVENVYAFFEDSNSPARSQKPFPLLRI